MNVSLFQNFRREHLYRDPFPYIVIENALPESIHDELLKSYPSPELQQVNSSLNNFRWSTKARDIASIPNLADLWRQMIQYHTSQMFLDEVFKIFEQDLLEMFPERFPTQTALYSHRATTRSIAPPDRGSLALDAQIAGNTPVRTPTSPRGIHCDAPNALYGGLYYLRDSWDNSVGGDLQIWKWQSHYSFRRKSGEYRESVPLKHVSLVRTIPYISNTFVFFINSLDSLHSVTIRQPTQHTRKFINLLADADDPFFNLDPLFHHRVRNYLRHKVRAS
jgi:hypothetical protein